MKSPFHSWYPNTRYPNTRHVLTCISVFLCIWWELTWEMRVIHKRNKWWLPCILWMLASVSTVAGLQCRPTTRHARATVHVCYLRTVTHQLVSRPLASQGPSTPVSHWPYMNYRQRSAWVVLLVLSVTVHVCVSSKVTSLSVLYMYIHMYTQQFKNNIQLFSVSSLDCY